MSDELKPCPFCGGTDLDTRYENSVSCKNLDCGGEINLGHHCGPGAIKVRNACWNARPEPSTDELTEEMRKAGADMLDVADMFESSEDLCAAIYKSMNAAIHYRRARDED